MAHSVRAGRQCVCLCFCLCVCVREKVRKEKQFQTIPPFHSGDIRAAECVWANDSLSNRVASELWAHESASSARRAACYWCNQHAAASDVTAAAGCTFADVSLLGQTWMSKRVIDQWRHSSSIYDTYCLFLLVWTNVFPLPGWKFHCYQRADFCLTYLFVFWCTVFFRSCSLTCHYSDSGCRTRKKVYIFESLEWNGCFVPPLC